MTKALIVGGGISGATAAMALHKAGIDSVVYEAYATDAENVGAFLTVMNNGMAALRAIDAHQTVIDNSFPAIGTEYISANGKWINERAYPEDSGSISLPRTLKRGALNRLLHDELRRRGLTVEHNKCLRHAETRPDGTVEAHFTDGRSASGDLLIGADGLHSVTRGLIDPDAPKPRYVGMNTIIGYTTDAISEPSPRKYRMFYGKRAFFGYITDPDGETWWFVRIPGPEIPKQALRETGAEEWRKSAAGFFTEDSIPAIEVISKRGPVFAINIYDLSSVRNWHGSSMVLIGDAVHALSPSAGQGASMAIEDSVVLAKCLRDVPNLAAAFATYEGMRRDRVEQVLTTALAADPGVISWRRVIHRVLHDFKIAREQTRGNHPHSWIYDYRLDWASTVNSS